MQAIAIFDKIVFDNIHAKICNSNQWKLIGMNESYITYECPKCESEFSTGEPRTPYFTGIIKDTPENIQVCKDVLKELNIQLHTIVQFTADSEGIITEETIITYD